MVAIRPFERAFGRIDESFENDLGCCRYLQIGAQALHHFGLGPAQQTGKLVFGETVRNRRHCRENRRRIGAQCHRHRERLTRMLQAVLAKIERAAAVRQPAHDHPVAPDHLLAIDAQVLAALVRPARHRQSPGDQWRCVARPAELDRQTRQVDVFAFPDEILARRRRTHTRRHVEHLPEYRQLVPGILESLRRFRLLEVGEQLADLAQGQQRVLPHAQRHPPRRAKEIGQHRHVMPSGILEEERRAAGTQHAIANLGHLQVRVYLHSDALEFTETFQLRDEVAQVVIFHRPWGYLRR
ncbi:MAG: hypothetical protein AW09_000096 [Candidatus Accumulibacter phosphatis]|uniref:Uncharacterized protein n=1 Tax=Candidatus Accumulibacter phosphatis TaxID=327160 RepID=A0A080M099_9PROT|nr:MAG: hypothetical protein AW09_000096 [Candidatus Accumulibacter phosphatis]